MEQNTVTLNQVFACMFVYVRWFYEINYVEWHNDCCDAFLNDMFALHFPPCNSPANRSWFDENSCAYFKLILTNQHTILKLWLTPKNDVWRNKIAERWLVEWNYTLVHYDFIFVIFQWKIEHNFHLLNKFNVMFYAY